MLGCTKKRAATTLAVAKLLKSDFIVFIILVFAFSLNFLIIRLPKTHNNMRRRGNEVRIMSLM